MKNLTEISYKNKTYIVKKVERTEQYTKDEMHKHTFYRVETTDCKHVATILFLDDNLHDCVGSELMTKDGGFELGKEIKSLMAVSVAKNLTEAKVENKKTFLLSLMTKSIAHQKKELESSGWDVDYMIEEGSIQRFFESIIFGEDDVCEQVLADFIEEHELEEMDLADTSFIDEARNMQHELIEHMTELYS